MKKKIKKKLDISKMKISRLSEPGDKKAKVATIPPRTFWCDTTGLY
ncbi:hypothetical protein ACTJJ0_08080 [Chitinophaga sp. 22321]|uniref:Uncharacterized protein n=1 Tax=Chitinophaga hostae TaxID=2831022 RepID=A0ABS5ITM6_9BACT|nr:hypothetical protein [Chitinophaga hostae]MBS0026317.1 hypothetical protein [Chitinophaga hostae]